MQNPPPFAEPHHANQARLEQLQAMAEAIERVLDLSLIFAQSGRRIDLAGLDRRLGLLCAQALDLPPSLGAQLVPALQSHIARLDQLTALFQSRRM